MLTSVYSLIQTIGPIKVQTREDAKSIAETGEKWNIKAMNVTLLFWPYLIKPENYKTNEEFKRRQRYIVFHAHTQFWLMGSFVLIKLWKIASLHSSSAAHWDQGSCRREEHCAHFMSLIFLSMWNEDSGGCPAVAEGQRPAGSIMPRQLPSASPTRIRDFVPFCHFTKWDSEEGGDTAQSALHPHLVL